MGAADAKPKILLWRRLLATSIDLSIVYSLSLIFQFLIYWFTFISFDLIFVATLITYYLFCYLVLSGQTIAKQMVGVKLLNTRISKANPIRIVLREVVLKGFTGIVLPFYIISSLVRVWCVVIPYYPIAVLLLLLCLFILLIWKRTWWELLSSTVLVKQTIDRSKSWKAFGFMTSIFVISILINIYPFAIQGKNAKTSFYPSYPKTKETTKYAEFIKTHAKDPVDYVFDLFKENDTVVLSERYHPEYTQYEFISKIVSDKRFKDDVGNILTECGSVSFQDTVNKSAYFIQIRRFFRSCNCYSSKKQQCYLASLDVHQSIRPI